MQDSMRLSGRRPDLEQIGNAAKFSINTAPCDKDREMSSQNKELLSMEISVR